MCWTREARAPAHVSLSLAHARTRTRSAVVRRPHTGAAVGSGLRGRDMWVLRVCGCCASVCVCSCTSLGTRGVVSRCRRLLAGGARIRGPARRASKHLSLRLHSCASLTIWGLVNCGPSPRPARPLLHLRLSSTGSSLVRNVCRQHLSPAGCQRELEQQRRRDQSRACPSSPYHPVLHGAAARARAW